MAKLEKIKTLSDTDIRKWLRIIKEEDLLRGLLGVDPEIKNRILQNMSPSAGKAIDEYGQEHKGLPKIYIDKSLDSLEKILNSI